MDLTTNIWRPYFYKDYFIWVMFVGECKHNQVYMYKKVFWYTKTMIFLIKRLKVASSRCFNWIFFMKTSNNVLKYPNIEYQDEFFKTYY